MSGFPVFATVYCATKSLPLIFAVMLPIGSGGSGGAMSNNPQPETEMRNIMAAIKVSWILFISSALVNTLFNSESNLCIAWSRVQLIFATHF